MTKRAAIYARYSSDLQKATSIEDQVAMARRLCDREGWSVTATFVDQEMSGRTDRRPGLQAMMRAARAREFDVIVVEAVDRLTRRIVHALQSYELFQFAGIDLYSVTEGKQEFMTVLMNSFGAESFSKMIGEHTRRGMQGALRRKRLHSCAYGYRIVDRPEGLNREIDPDQAAVVLRIFEELAEGKSSLQITHDLNRDGIPAPKGGTWGGSTIRGHGKRQEGIAHNRLYIGRASVCRFGRRPDPETGAKSTFATPQDTVEVEIPELRIVPQELWDRAQAEIERRSTTRAATGNANTARRRKALLSGILVCGTCGQRYVIVGRNRYGCSEARKHACDNRVTITRKTLEAQVLGRLRASLRSPEFERRFCAALKAERARLAGDGPERELKRLSAALLKARKARDHIFKAIEDGAPFDAFRARAAALEAEIRDIEAKRRALEERQKDRGGPADDPARAYEAVLAQLETLLSDPELVDQAHRHIADLFPRVTLHPDARESHGLRLEITSTLDRLLPGATTR